VLAISSTLALFPVDARRNTVASRSQRQHMAVGTLSEGNQQVVTFLPHLLGYW
jgi:hypothetical protein